MMPLLWKATGDGNLPVISSAAVGVLLPWHGAFGGAVGSDPGGLSSSAGRVSWTRGEMGGMANGIPRSSSGVTLIPKHRDKVVVSPTNAKPALNSLPWVRVTACLRQHRAVKQHKP